MEATILDGDNLNRFVSRTQPAILHLNHAVIWRAAWSDRPPTSDAPEHGKTNFGAVAQLH